MNWMTVKNIAEYLSLSTMMVYKLAQEGRIPAVKIGRVWRFEKEAIDQWLRKNMSSAPDVTTRLISNFSQSLQSIFGSNLVRVIIFGSHARGDAKKDSDIDVLVVVKSIDDYWQLHGKMENAAYDVTFGVNEPFILSPILIDEKEYLTSTSPLMLNVRREGKIAA